MEQTVLRFLKVIGTWREVADAARTTIRMGAGTKEPTPAWKRRILLAEHSPIRKLLVSWIEHFVSTQRTDRTGEDRTVKPQDAPVEHECIANASEMMFISRRRLCAQASPETRAAWKMVIDALAEKEPELASCCVPECVYRGFCPEFKSCGYVDTPAYAEAVKRYRG